MFASQVHIHSPGDYFLYLYSVKMRFDQTAVTVVTYCELRYSPEYNEYRNFAAFDYEGTSLTDIYNQSRPYFQV